MRNLDTAITVGETCIECCCRHSNLRHTMDEFFVYSTKSRGSACYTQHDCLLQLIDDFALTVVLQLLPRGSQIAMSSVLFFSRPQSEGWPHHGRTFFIYLCPLSLWLTLPREVQFMCWCCQSRPCVVFLACVHLALFLALSLSSGNSLVSPRCDHSMLASFLWQCLTVPSLLQLC